MYCTVVTTSKSAGIGNGLTYESPDISVVPGSVVRVPLRNKIVEGMVVRVRKKRQQEAYDLKQVKRLLSTTPLITKYHLNTMRWMAEYYCCSLRQALRVFLPAPPWDTLLPLRHEVIELNPKADISGLRGSKQLALIAHLKKHGRALVRQAQEDLGVSRTTIRNLLQRGILTQKSIEEPATVELEPPTLNLPTLTPDQAEVYDQIKRSTKPSLLFGVTGSGKTEVYMHAIADAIRGGGQALVLLPEILLTENFLDRFAKFIDPKRIMVLHSRLTPGRKRGAWRRISRGEVDLVIGSRSALFAPLRRLKVIVIDEEHEWTYKNEQTPRYHARETAEVLAKEADAKLILGSATPSIESWSRARSGVYELHRLTKRYGQLAVPTVRVIDLAEANFGNSYPLTTPLLEAIDQRLTKNQQSILFLNRRGVASSLLCLDCRRRIVSPVSQLPFTVHQRNGTLRLIDHMNNVECDAPAVCPNCQSARLQLMGAGTQKLEELLKGHFPKARLLRADSDTLKSPEKIRELLRAMNQGEADILLGTQSVVKGLDLPQVTLAAVLLADIGLSLPHFRAGERVFQILTQLTGRSGRHQPGEVIIQTFRPDAPEVKLAANHATEQFLENELQLRQHTSYPPAAPLIRLLCRGDKAEAEAKKLKATLDKYPDLKASCSPTLFSGGAVWQVFIRGEKGRLALAQLDLSKAVVDIDPIDCV